RLRRSALKMLVQSGRTLAQKTWAPQMKLLLMEQRTQSLPAECVPPERELRPRTPSPLHSSQSHSPPLPLNSSRLAAPIPSTPAIPPRARHSPPEPRFSLLSAILPTEPAWRHGSIAAAPSPDALADLACASNHHPSVTKSGKTASGLLR